MSDPTSSRAEPSHSQANLFRRVPCCVASNVGCRAFAFDADYAAEEKGSMRLSGCGFGARNTFEIKAKLRRVAEMTQMTQKATFVPFVARGYGSARGENRRCERVVIPPLRGPC
jgi:hypothetical protein